MTLPGQAAEVRSREQFVEFVRALRRDLVEHPESWENADLPRFLDAMAAWLTDMDGYFSNVGQQVPQQPDWHLLGTMLMAARTYE